MSSTTEARALIKQLLGGDLVTATVTAERHALNVASEYLPLFRGPVASVTSVTVDGTAVTSGQVDGWEAERWGIRRAHGYAWPAGVKILVTYVVGWDSGSEPNEIQEAINTLTEWMDTSPQNALNAIEIGNARVERLGTNQDVTTQVPRFIETFLREWIRPRAF